MADVALALGYYANFEMTDFLETPMVTKIGNMKLAHVIYHWKRNLMLINFYKRSMPLKRIVFKLYAILTIQQTC